MRFSLPYPDIWRPSPLGHLLHSLIGVADGQVAARLGAQAEACGACTGTWGPPRRRRLRSCLGGPRETSQDSRWLRSWIRRERCLSFSVSDIRWCVRFDKVGKGIIPALRCDQLVRFKGMSIESQSNTWIRMAKALRNRRDWDAAAKQLARVCVPHGMQTDARVSHSFRDLRYPRAHLIGFIVVPVRIAKNQIEISVRSLNTPPVLLVPAVFHENVQSHRRQWETSRVAGFGALNPKAVFRLFEALGDSDHSGLKIDVPPLQGQELATAATC
jgi:hypothetical protein